MIDWEWRDEQGGEEGGQDIGSIVSRYAVLVSAIVQRMRV